MSNNNNTLCLGGNESCLPEGIVLLVIVFIQTPVATSQTLIVLSQEALTIFPESSSTQLIGDRWPGLLKEKMSEWVLQKGREEFKPSNTWKQEKLVEFHSLRVVSRDPLTRIWSSIAMHSTSPVCPCTVWVQLPESSFNFQTLKVVYVSCESMTTQNFDVELLWLSCPHCQLSHSY